MGRRELRDEIQSRWVVHEPRYGSAPFRKRDLDAASERGRQLPSEPVDESSEARRPPAPRDSSAGSEGG